MSDFPSMNELIAAIAKAISNTDTRHNDHTTYSDAVQLSEKAMFALLDILPKCEEPHSAAYCYEQLERMRGTK